MNELHTWRVREGRPPLHLASCPCWCGTSFTTLREPRSSLFAYLSSPRRSRGTTVFPW